MTDPQRPFLSDDVAVLGQILAKLIELVKVSQGRVVQDLSTLQKENREFREEWKAFRTEILNSVYSGNQTAALNSRRMLPISRHPIRCVFIVHNEALWDVLNGVYRAMRNDKGFEPIVVTIPYEENYWKTRTLKREDAIHERLTQLDVPHLRLNMPDSYAGLDIIKALAPDIIFRQTAIDGPYPPGYRTAELSFARICYVSTNGFSTPAENALAGGEADSGLFYADKHFHQLCWKIFCETETHRDLYARASTRGGSNLVVAGCPRSDDLLEAAHTKPPLWPVNNPDGKKRFCIVWLPGFGRFPDIYEDMLIWARENGDVEFTLDMQPSLVTALVEEKKLTQAEIVAFLAAWNALPNAALHSNRQRAPLFTASHALITDNIGLCADYQPFGKPTLFLSDKQSGDLNATAEIVMQSVNRVTNVAEVRALCARLQKGEPDPMRKLREKNLPRIHPFPGQSAAKILDAIRDGLAEERRER